MAEITNYKCRDCGGTLQFSSTKQKLVCDSCGAEYDVSEFEQAQASGSQQQQYTAKENQWDVDAEGLVVYECKNCGGEIVGDKSMASTKCPYCDNPIVISSKFEGSLKPDVVIPFKLNKHAAQDHLKDHVNKIKLAPAAFKAGNHIKEVKGVYVPFWLYDADVHARATYDARKEKKTEDANYEYTETSFYDVMREGDMKFQNIPADASEKMDDKLMDSIEPYDLSAGVPYSSAYMAGYFADRYDVTAEQCKPRAEERIEHTAKDLLKKKVKDYNTVYDKSSDVDLRSCSYKYALLPVWILNTVWNGNKYTFAMNGQTGKLVGDVPYSKGKFWGILLGASAGLALIMFLIAKLIGMSGGAMGVMIALGVIAGIIIAMVMKGATKSVHKGYEALEYVIPGSFKITNQYDNFVKTETSKKPKNKS
ncbi:MAG: YrzE family protein [Eubacterium sp.]|nr:YrzE family protein [Eubacterium sp.]